ncbi:MAG: aconitate hydratase AcnA [Thermoflexales bacterium]|nr:aconitate hydratase AcnA [Thermoflexales bacterium]
MSVQDHFGARDTFETGSGPAGLYRLEALEKRGVAPAIGRLPFSIKVLLESLLRAADDATPDDVIQLANWNAERPALHELPFKPARVLMQDLSGVPAVVDLAAMRSAARRLGGDPRRVNPLLPVDLVIDHSVHVDVSASPSALQRNTEIEFERNRERYEFLRWGQKSFDNFRVIPPATGIIHQVNLEFLAQVVVRQDELAFPDTLVGTDSHTTMVNGLGVLGWGVGGIEAEAVMLGQPLYMLTPQVVGCKLYGHLREGVTATDLTLTVVQLLRKSGVVDKFVEFFGPGVSQMVLTDRATIANMAPEYGATMGFFPIDDETLRYLRFTNRAGQAQLVERYAKEQGLFRTGETPEPEFSAVLELDLASVEPSLAGPKRPQDRMPLAQVKASFQALVPRDESHRDRRLSTIDHGAVVIAAITSCTNTSNPSVMLGAGLLARKAVERGLQAAPHVKTSLSPGSRVVTEYLKEAGLLPYLERLGFHVVGYGCMTCIGNSGPLPAEISQAITDDELVVAAVLSGNRNFEGRISPCIKANYLASPPLVVAYALAGTLDIDLSTEPLGTGSDGRPVYLHDIWPTQAELAQAVEQAIKPEMFERVYADVFEGNPAWNAIPLAEGELYAWDAASTYIQEPPFLADMALDPPPLAPIRAARVLALLGDSVTTDHISPAGSIAENSPAGRYLLERGVQKHDFNTYGARRGNDQVLTRGAFANIRLKNLLVPGVEGGLTLYLPSPLGRGAGGEGEVMSIYDAAQRYKAAGVPLLVLAGKEYGTGSSRDWAAKGPALLGVKAVLAESFERIHRSNLVGMGLLPLQFKPGETVQSLGLNGREVFSVEGIDDSLQPRQALAVRAEKPDGSVLTFAAIARLDTPVDVEYYRNGGILQTVLRRLVRNT